jgi:plastocyanin
MRKVLLLTSALVLTIVIAIPVMAKDKAFRIVGDEAFAANKMIESDFHFTPGVMSVESGGSLTWNNKTDDEHTVTLVEESQVPPDFDGVFECRDPGGPCRAALDAHFATDPPTDTINVGAAGLDTPGDSLLIDEEGSVTAVISAPSGTDLYFICSVHPWMQGEIEVE